MGFVYLQYIILVFNSMLIVVSTNPEISIVYTIAIYKLALLIWNSVLIDAIRNFILIDAIRNSVLIDAIRNFILIDAKED